MDKNKKNNILSTIKYISGILGIIAIVIAILTITNVTREILLKYEYSNVYGDREKLVLSLTSSILGIFFLFIAFSKQIDKFFGFLETHEIGEKNEEGNAISLESIFFFIIGTVLVVLAVMLAVGFLTLKTQLPLLGGATKTILITALIILAVLAFITAFNNIIMQSVKEMKKVHWPTNKEMMDYSKKVFSFIIFFSIFFFALDLIIHLVLEDWLGIKL